MDKFDWWPLWKWWKLDEQDLPQDPLWESYDKKIGKYVPVLAAALILVLVLKEG